jgi:flagellar assembly protein FliH
MTEIPSVRKFMFTRSFDKGAEEPRVPVFTEEQVKAAHDAGFQEGYRAGQASTQEEQQAQFNSLVEQIAASLENITGELTSRRQTQEQGVSDIAIAIAAKVLPSAVQRGGFDEIKAQLESIMRDMSNEPRLVVRVAPSLQPQVEELMKDLSQRQAFEGQLLVLADEGLGPSDCRVEWSDGGLERNLDLFWKKLDETVARLTGNASNAAQVMAETPAVASASQEEVLTDTVPKE